MFNNMLNRGKDATLSMAVKKIINLKIKKFGNVSKLDLDSALKTMLLEIDLKGETELLEVKVEKYSIEEKFDKFFLKIDKVKTSREWLNIVILEYLKNQEFELPSQHIKLIKAVI